MDDDDDGDGDVGGRAFCGTWNAKVCMYTQNERQGCTTYMYIMLFSRLKVGNVEQFFYVIYVYI